MGHEQGYNVTCHFIWEPIDFPRPLGKTVICSFICVVCILGLLGNGAVIWLLGFRLKRNHFAIYILNLAVTDFGVLISLMSVVVLYLAGIHVFHNVGLRFLMFWVPSAFYSTSQFLLTAISIDRSVAVLFSIWYQFHRPRKLSIVLCVVIWLLSFSYQGIGFSTQLFYFGEEKMPPTFYAFLVNAIVCLPLITVSTLILFVRICCISQQRQRGKLLTAILLTLFFFLIFAFPLNIINLILLNFNLPPTDRFNLRCYNVAEYGTLCACLNSFVNPLLYFLVGRKKRGLCRENLKLILQRVFMEEEEARREESEAQL